MWWQNVLQLDSIIAVASTLLWRFIFLIGTDGYNPLLVVREDIQRTTFELFMLDGQEVRKSDTINSTCIPIYISAAIRVSGVRGRRSMTHKGLDRAPLERVSATNLTLAKLWSTWYACYR